MRPLDGGTATPPHSNVCVVASELLQLAASRRPLTSLACSVVFLVASDLVWPSCTGKQANRQQHVQGILRWAETRPRGRRVPLLAHAWVGWVGHILRRRGVLTWFQGGRASERVACGAGGGLKSTASGSYGSGATAGACGERGAAATTPAHHPRRLERYLGFVGCDEVCCCRGPSPPAPVSPSARPR